MTQYSANDDLILAALKNGDALTPAVAAQRWGCLALHSAIARLRKAGHKISTRMVSGHGEYRIIASNEKAAPQRQPVTVPCSTPSSVQPASAALALALFGIFGVVGKIDMEAARADEAEREATTSAFRLPPSALVEARRLLTERELAKGFATCPPRGEGMTDIVTLVIKTSADGAPEKVTCIRYAERPFTPKRRPAVRG